MFIKLLRKTTTKEVWIQRRRKNKYSAAQQSKHGAISAAGKSSTISIIDYRVQS